MRSNATVIFDFDGTLANSVDLIFDLYNQHSDDFGYKKASRKEIDDLRKLGYKKTMKLKGIKMRFVPKMIVTLTKEMRERMDEVHPYDGVIAEIDKLKNEGYRVGILTSNQTAIVKYFLSKHKFPDFDFIVSEKTLFGKHKALKKIFKLYNLEKDQVIYIGDEPRDVTACRKAGIRVIGVSWGLGGNVGFEKNYPDLLINNPSELFPSVQSFSK